MYVMYFGMLSMITPPVAIAAYAAANIARVSGWTTGWVSVMVGWSTFFIPFLFVLEPALLMNAPWHLVVWHLARNLLKCHLLKLAKEGRAAAEGDADRLSGG